MTERHPGEPPSDPAPAAATPSGGRPAAETVETVQRHPGAPAPGTRIGSHYRRCVGCGPDHPTGLHVAVVAGDGLAVSGRFTVTDDHQGAPGLAHGGMLALAFDEVMGALIHLVGRPAVTGRLETTYRRPVPVGTTLHIDAVVDRVDGRKIHVSATGHENAPGGPVSVVASAVFVTVPASHFVEHGGATARAERAGGTTRATEVNP